MKSMKRWSMITDNAHIRRGWDQHLRRYHDLRGVGFARLGKNYNKWLYRAKKRVLLRLIRSLNLDISSTEVVDVGSGVGFYVDLWIRMGVRSVTGIDIAPFAVELLRRRFSDCTFLEMDISDKHKIRGAYERGADVVTAIDVLYHILDDERYEQAFYNIAQFIRPGRYFIFSENFISGPALRQASEVFRPKEYIYRLLQANNFEILSRVPLLFWGNVPADRNSSIFNVWWKVWSRLVERGEIWGYILGMLLFPIEIISTRVFRESPTTEIVIARKSTNINTKGGFVC
ncbi:MAG: class I SAM-dependent methyltransferase [Deltaproteobacteria bacterium]|nr:class I SAM-dependent methyltransferase [Deltaproteobacteria bacterium]